VVVRRVFHKVRSRAIFGYGGQVPTHGLRAKQRYVLGAVLVYQLALLHRFQTGGDLRVGLKAMLKAT
jgi:hypothetical protein